MPSPMPSGSGSKFAEDCVPFWPGALPFVGGPEPSPRRLETPAIAVLKRVTIFLASWEIVALKLCQTVCPNPAIACVAPDAIRPIASGNCFIFAQSHPMASESAVPAVLAAAEALARMVAAVVEIQSQTLVQSAPIFAWA